MHKAGFVNIIGNPNVGKSTLMNALVGEKLSIITSKAQTTRHRIMGIVNGDDFQIIYSDTPGYIEATKYALQSSMMNFVNTALIDADIILYVVDINEQNDSKIENKIKQSQAKVIIVINKIDTTDQKTVEQKFETLQQKFPDAEIILTSALLKANIGSVFEKIIENLPISPPYFEKDALTDKPERFFASEIIREKIFLNYQQEVPYATEVLIEKFENTPSLLRITATIIVERISQRSIIIGKNGNNLKKVGIQARKDLEAFFNKKVFLQTYVKVDKDWRHNLQQLKKFGYVLGIIFIFGKFNFTLFNITLVKILQNL